MCDHCGCREVTPIQRLMAEHERLLDMAGEIRDALRVGDSAIARGIFGDLAALLMPHVRAEERGLFAVMRERGEFIDHIDTLESEHGELAARLAATLDDEAILQICDQLRAHIYAENFGLFPAALASLGGDDWADIEEREGRTTAGTGEVGQPVG
ncbi:hemerythrin domain-containing protein [Thermopolyspora sp. NPDC052614]|uniref:hemerythrin domain-containing protein n=1 Tax=Thermopolyspora sp. NPDC052614 TaxID=3155682 RepID=UPI003427E90F